MAKALPVAMLAFSLLAGACAEDTTTSTAGEDAAIEGISLGLAYEGSAYEGSAFDALPTPEEQAGLAYMREEEKLAGDVYRAMFELWGLTIFDNIASAEDTHTAAVARLLDQFGLADPAEGRAPGVFSDPQLQDLYDELVAIGSRSETDALIVGALIEELDIADIRERATDDPAISGVYADLERGSTNHLRAFVRQLDRRGVRYEPDHLSQEAFDEIVTTNAARGGGRRSDARGT